MKLTDKLNYKKYVLKGALERYVKYIWIMKCQETLSEKDLLIPDGYPEIIFVKNGAYQKEFLIPNTKPQIIKKSCIIGIQTQTVLASRMNQCFLIGVKLNPVGAYALFGKQLGNISTSNLYIEDFGEIWLSQLNQKIQKSNDKDSIIHLLTASLLLQLKDKKHQRKIKLATSYLETILSIDKTIPIRELAARNFVSVRQYQRNFKMFFGISPKTFLNIIRFKQLYKSSILEQKEPKDFLDYGYYDQMHFIKDFQKRLGISPSRSLNGQFIQMNEIARTSL
ncbi:DUF6597 domain-containing transcriptional factor [Ascidiimonas sp. W6]|uniref:DUF6597 domain-containing transcriptional factor n=1 Tax=Ascidiimonas meishanensis TaxID=3128903 RepID=UPI0030EE8834